MQSDVILLKFPDREEVRDRPKSLLRFGRKRQRETPSPTPSPTFANEDDAVSSSVVRHGGFRSHHFPLLGGFHVPTVVNYSTFLFVSLVLWALYLILPRGMRQYMCNAYPKRYRRSSPNRVVRILGKRNPASSQKQQQQQQQQQQMKQQREKNFRLSPNSSSDYSNASSSSSVNSTLRRGTEKFMAMKRRSPQRKPSSSWYVNSNSQDEAIPMDGRVHSGISEERRNWTYSYSSSDLSSITGMGNQPPDTHTSGVMSERNKLISANSSDLSSIPSNGKDNSETMSSTGHAIWGTPKRFVRKRIIDEGKSLTNQYSDSDGSRRSMGSMVRKALGDMTSDDEGESMTSSEYEEHQTSHREQRKQSQHLPPPPPLSEIDSIASSYFPSVRSSSSSEQRSTNENQNEPSPNHPDQTCGHNTPSQMVLSSTLLSFRDPGIRLYAHGTQCEPRRIWIRLDVMNEQLSWRTENVGTSNGTNDPNLVTLGQVHEIPLIQVLFVDVGKTTAALQLLDVHDDYCFSILTNGGSLDLQASNKLERDALISCMCLILDTVYNHLPPEKSWRRLNDGAMSESSSSFSSKTGSKNADNRAVRQNGNQTRPSESSRASNTNSYPSSSSSSAAGSFVGSDVFHGVDLGSQVSSGFGEI